MNKEWLNINNTELGIDKNEPPYFFDIAKVINDETLIYDNKKNLSQKVVVVLLSVFMASLGFHALWGAFAQARIEPNYIGSAEFIVGVPFMLCVFLFSIVMIINVIINSDRIFIFNRIEGTVTMRASVLNWKNRTVTFPFKDVRLRFLTTRYVSNMMIGLPQSNFWALFLMGTTDKEDEERCIPFFTWYMDKNRPLPPLEALDPYREKDYLRRREEGFPAPLYPSTIETPEWEGAESKYKDKDVKRRNKESRNYIVTEK